mmetsp:Transcript_111825/g.361011  ORF Transcript_111825/g.361011 Transcript_111825/m.361011 type:complete len:230 (+) Transcript_111825:63-752(+)
MAAQRTAVLLLALAGPAVGISLKSPEAEQQQAVATVAAVLKQASPALHRFVLPAILSEASRDGACSDTDRQSLKSFLTSAMDSMKGSTGTGMPTIPGMPSECDTKGLMNGMSLNYDGLEACIKKATGISDTCTKCPMDFAKDVFGTSFLSMKCLPSCMGLVSCKDESCKQPGLQCARCMEPAAGQLGACMTNTDAKAVEEKIEVVIKSVEDGSASEDALQGIFKELGSA